MADSGKIMRDRHLLNGNQLGARSAGGRFWLVWAAVLTLGFGWTQPVIGDGMALRLLERGNARFAGGTMMHPNLSPEQRHAIEMQGAHPFAAVLTCSDPRMVPEILFDQGVGDLVVVRMAAGAATTDAVANLEVAWLEHKIGLITLLGHTDCYEVLMSTNRVSGPVSNTAKILKRLQTATPASQKLGNASNRERVEARVQSNLLEVLERSTLLRAAVSSGELMISGAILDHSNGGITWLDVPDTMERVLKLPGTLARRDPIEVRTAADQELDLSFASVEKKKPVDGVMEVHARQQTSARMTQRFMQTGNLRFASGKLDFAEQSTNQLQSTGPLVPGATILTSSDSRMAVEHIFNAGLGEFHVVRSAGIVVDDHQIASLELGIVQSQTPLLVVLAVRDDPAYKLAASPQPPTPNLAALFKELEPILEAKPDEIAAQSLKYSVDEILLRSSPIRKLVEMGRCVITPAIYDPTSGTVQWMPSITSPTEQQTHPTQAGTPADHPPDQTHETHKIPSAKPHSNADHGNADHGNADHGDADQSEDGAGEKPAFQKLKIHTQQPVYEVLSALEKGNDRFVNNGLENRSSTRADEIRKSLAQTNPSVAILAPSDLSIPLETIFDQPQGSFFAVRVLGNVADTASVSSLEFAITRMQTPLLIFLGHDRDMVVESVRRGEAKEPSSVMKPILDRIQPAIARAGSSAALIDVVRANLMQSMIDTLKISETIRVAFHDGKVDFIGAIYHNETGNIEWVRPGE